MTERIRLGKRSVDGIQPDPAGRFIVWDTDLKGFGLHVLPSGVKSFIFDYRTAEGVKRRITIGKMSGSLTPDQARRVAEEKHIQVKQGKDPAAERREAREALTVSDILDEYVKSEAFAAKADSTQATDKGRIERHLKPIFGKEFVGKLTGDTIRRGYRDIAGGRTAATIKTGFRGLARVQGGEGTAKKAILLLGAALNWGKDEGFKVENPVALVKLKADGVRNIVLDNQDDYRKMFQAIDDLEEKGVLRRAAADAVRLIALTGARKSEITGLRWRHVDLKTGVIRLAADENKGGKTSGEERIIGLPATAQAIIARQGETREPDGLVFTLGSAGKEITLAKPWASIRAAAGLSEGLGLHGLRHSLATAMAMAGAGASEIMTLLGHRDISTSQKYVHYAQDKRQELAERAAASISASMKTEEGEGVVVQMGRAKK
jgi:integrase